MKGLWMICPACGRRRLLGVGVVPPLESAVGLALALALVGCICSLLEAPWVAAAFLSSAATALFTGWLLLPVTGPGPCARCGSDG